MTVRTAELLMGILMLIASIGIMVKSTELNIGWVPERGPGGGAWPFFLAGGMAIASIATIVRWFLGLTPESRSTEPYIDSDTVFLVVISTLGILGLIGLMELIGTYFALMIYLAFALRFIGGHAWYPTLGFMLGGPLFVFCLFEWALQKDIPKGALMPESLYYPLYDVIYAPNSMTIGGILSAWIIGAIVAGGLEEKSGRRGVLVTLGVLAVGFVFLAGASLGIFGLTGVLVGFVIAALGGFAYHFYRNSTARQDAGGETS